MMTRKELRRRKGSARALGDLMEEGARALINRLGYANAARFIAILGGKRIKRRRASRKMSEEKEDYSTELGFVIGRVEGKMK